MCFRHCFDLLFNSQLHLANVGKHFEIQSEQDYNFKFSTFNSLTIISTDSVSIFEA